MLRSQESRYLPNADRLSVLAAAILLAYALAQFVDLPVQDLSVQLPGIFLKMEINVQTVVAFLVAGLTASGADWLLREHPALHNQGTFEHWFLPALTAWVIGVALSELPMGVSWWAVFAVGGGLLILVLVAEYIVVDSADVRQAPAAVGLTAVSFALYLILAIVLRSANVRLYGILPALTLAAGLVSLRTLHLRLHGQWKIAESMVIALIVGQIAAAVHYWPLSPVAFGLAVLGPAYALTSLISSIEEGEPLKRALLEPLLVLILLWGAAAWAR
jgi:hypothetical protein